MKIYLLMLMSYNAKTGDLSDNSQIKGIFSTLNKAKKYIKDDFKNLKVNPFADKENLSMTKFYHNYEDPDDEIDNWTAIVIDGNKEWHYIIYELNIDEVINFDI